MAYNIEQKEGESLKQYYRRLAKTADERLVRLEALSHEEHYKNVKNWAYRKAQYDIKSWSGKDATRFNTKPPEDQEKLIAKINDIKDFLSSKTSQKSDIIRTYKNRAKKLNKNYGTDFTWEDLATYYEQGKNKDWDERLGYKTALQTIGVIQHNKDTIVQAVKDAKGKHINVVASEDEIPDGDGSYLVINEKDPIILNKVEQALNDSKLDINDLF